MADQQPPSSPPWWQQLVGAAIAALAPVIVKGVLSGIAALEKALAPWDGVERRGAPPPTPPAGGTP